MRCCPPGIPRSKRSAPLRTSWGRRRVPKAAGFTLQSPPDSKPRAARGADGDGDTDRALTGRGGAVLPVPKSFQARRTEQGLC